ARFWSQTMRWLAGRSLEDQRPLLTVSTNKTDYGVGEKVVVKLERQANAKVEGQPQLTVDIKDPADERVALPLKVDSSNPDLASAEFYPSRSGRFEVLAALTSGGKPLANQTAEFLVQGQDLELADVGVYPRALRDIAEATGGIYYEIDDAEKLADKVPAKDRK